MKRKDGTTDRKKEAIVGSTLGNLRKDGAIKGSFPEEKEDRSRKIRSWKRKTGQPKTVLEDIVRRNRTNLFEAGRQRKKRNLFGLTLPNIKR